MSKLKTKTTPIEETMNDPKHPEREPAGQPQGSGEGGPGPGTSDTDNPSTKTTPQSEVDRQHEEGGAS